MPNYRIKVIANPNADLGRAWKRVSRLRHSLDELGTVDWVGSVYPKHTIDLARQAAEQGYDLVIAAGGDGTVHEVINGLMQAPSTNRPRLGVIPLGSGNDFAHAAGYSRDPYEAVRQITTGSVKTIDLALLVDGDGRQVYWDNTLGIGFDATVTIRSRALTALRGFIVYLVAVLQTIALNHNAPRLQVQTDRENWKEETLLLVLCNGRREGGGFDISPQALNNDGILNYAGIRKVSRLMMLRLLPEVIKGTHARFAQVRTGSFTRIDILSDHPLVIHTDGEIFAGLNSNVLHLSVEILPEALEIIV